MSKLWLIVKREYLTRVRTRAFLLGTLLTPLAFGAFFVIQGMMMSYKGAEKRKIIVFDEAGVVKSGTGIADERGLQFSVAPQGSNLEELKNDVRNKKYDGVLRLPPLANLAIKKQTIYLYTDEQFNPETEGVIKRRIASKIKDFKIDSLHLDRKSLGDLDTEVSLDPEPIDKKDDQGSSLTSGVAMGISFFMGIAMYMLVLIWGSIVMRSVMEEKTNRIVEVIMSSVKPFDLMLGKILGSAGVGLTQLIIWIILNTVIIIGVQFFFGIDASATQTGMPGGMPAGAAEEMQDKLPMLMNEIMRQNWWYILSMSLIFFLGGYFLYASLFAAVGSAVGDDMGEAQSLTMPITIPIILAFVIMSTVVMRAPHSTLAVAASIFPLFSPIVMPGRLAFHPPIWQVILSVVVLLGTAVFFVWLSGRIYRVGILMYGKKVSFKEIGKWMFYK
jgi:ABC-2 type transport system permease protein